MKRRITKEKLEAFEKYLIEDEKSERTIEKYMRDIRAFSECIGERDLEKKDVLSYKELLKTSYAVASANSMLAAINTFLKFMGWYDLCVRQMKQQRKLFCATEKELTREEYTRLVRTAKAKHNTRLALIIQTICATGIRVSELAYITYEAVKTGEAVVSCKGKLRTIILVNSLQKKLLCYAKERGIRIGAIFVTDSGRAVDRSNIWREMKALCHEAKVSPEKVFPHNLRHLFARTFYGIEKDIAKLADILGHSSINTTRIYMISSGREHRRRMEQLRLIL